MAVIRHVIDVGNERCCPPPSTAWRVVPLETATAVDCLAPLLRACEADPQLGPRPTLAGLRAELAAREGRVPVGFIAGSAAPRRAAETMGLAVVVEASGRAGRRFSLAWLLVHPAARRQGVATALLARAFAHVRMRGGGELSAETLGAWPDAVAFWKRMAAGSIPLKGPP